MDFKKRILVVEDVADSRELLAHLFRHSGYEVEEAARGLAAIAQVRATRPDLIIMDLGLPGSVSGDDVTARLKADPSTRDIPIIVYTAYPKGAPIVERARAVGAAEILHKPLSLRIVKATVDRYLSTEYMLHPANGRSRSFTVLSGGKGK